MYEYFANPITYSTNFMRSFGENRALGLGKIKDYHMLYPFLRKSEMIHILKVLTSPIVS